MKTFREYSPHQQFLLPPSLRDWLPDGHLALFVSDVVDALDLSAIFAEYGNGGGGGMPPYHPSMMVRVLVYGYCTGKTSSRGIERALHEEVPFRVLAANQHPDHDSIAAFRKRHLASLGGLFLQVLQMAAEMGLVKLGHVAVDGSKIKANASKHKAMSYERMNEKEKRLQDEVAALLADAARVDDEEDRRYGKGKRGDELPDELKRRESRLKKIAEAKASLEQEAKERAKTEATEVQSKLDTRAASEREAGKKMGGRLARVPDPGEAAPAPKAQRNFTDPESRIMLDGASKSFEQCYNAQIVVDDAHQVIIAADLTQQANDKRQLVPMLSQAIENMGIIPNSGSADCGYFSEAAVSDPSLSAIDLFVPPDRQKRAEVPLNPEDDPEDRRTSNRMRRKLAEAAGKAVYKMRKAIVEPVFGQIKQIRGFRRFSFRGLTHVTAEWLLVCATHNLLKMFRSGRTLPLLAA